MSFPLVDPKDDGIRPAGAPDECFYCNQKIGTPHAKDCVVVYKKVKLRLVIEVEVEEVHSWDDDMIKWVYEDKDHLTYHGEDVANGTVLLCEVVATTDPTPRNKLRDEEITGNN